jgi:hypothetical protein
LGISLAQDKIWKFGDPIYYQAENIQVTAFRENPGGNLAEKSITKFPEENLSRGTYLGINQFDEMRGFSIHKSSIRQI